MYPPLSPIIFEPSRTATRSSLYADEALQSYEC
jgi:hypothetical protein